MGFKEIIAKIEWKHLFILLLIFLVAFGFRANILKYPLMFEFDGYWHARMNAELIKTGQMPEYDFMGTYHNANKLKIPFWLDVGFWGAGAIIYKIMFFGQPYTDANMITLQRIIPALYGALAALFAYLLFAWAYKSKRIGYMAGFITAIMPAFIYRTMGGFYDDDCSGFMWMFLGLAFMVKAIKEPEFTKEKIIYAILGGISLAIMSTFWPVFYIVPVIMEGYFILTLIYNFYKGADKKELIAFVGLFAITYLIFTGFVSATQGFGWFNTQVIYGKGALGIEGGSSIMWSSSGVGEENTGRQFFGTKYGTFNFFIVLGIIAGLFGLYKRKYDYTTFLFIMWGLITFYLAWNKLKATFWFGTGLSVLTALTFAEVYLYLSNTNKKDITSKIIAITLGLLLFAGGVASAVLFVNAQVPNIVADAGWKDTVYFMRDNLPENAKMFNWWNWGHWITFIGHKLASTDNTNGDGQANRDFSKFVIDENFEEALGIIKAYDSDYVVLASEDISNQGIYAMYVYNKNSADYRVQSHLGYVMPCSRAINPIGNTTEYNCGGNKMSEQQMSGFAVNYQTKPNDLYQNKIPIFYYTNTQRNQFWMINSVNNSSTGAKLWFNAPETKKYFDLVYDNSYQKIFKVNKQEFTNITPYMLDMNLEQINEWNSKLWWLKDTNKSIN